MIYPKPLKARDRVGLIAPAGVVDPKKISAGMKFIKNLGLIPILGSNCTKKHGYFAGTDNERAEDINTMFNDKTIKGIFALRGGYGSQRLIEKIDFSIISANPKIFAGYSDLTALHIAINERCNLVTIHSPMVTSEFCEPIDNFTVNSFVQGTSIRNTPFSIKNPKGIPIKTLVSGGCTGRITGGNLSLVVSSLSTPYEIQTSEKILFLEDIGESPYKIDRMLTQLKHAGKFENVAGIMLGYFTDCENGKEGFSLLEVFEDFFVSLGKPCIYNVACGHSLPTLTLPMGGIAEFF